MGRGAGKYNVPLQQGSIATVSGYGAYANLGSQQVIIPQGAAGVQQYAAGKILAVIFQTDLTSDHMPRLQKLCLPSICALGGF